MNRIVTMTTWKDFMINEPGNSSGETERDIHCGRILILNIASRAAQSNSVYVSVLQISIVLANGKSKLIALPEFFFSREQLLLAWGKIFRFLATIMDRNRDSNHQSQNEDNFRPFLLG